MDRNTDLGFDMDVDVNLFESFHKQEDLSDLNLPDPDKDKDKEPDDQDDKKDKPPTPGATEEEQDNEIIADAIAEYYKNSKQSTEPDPPKKPSSDKKDNTDSSTGDDGDESPIRILYDTLVEKKLIEQYEGFDNTEEGLLAAIDDTIQNRRMDSVEEYIDEAFAKNPTQTQTAKDFIKHLMSGGTVASFKEAYDDDDIDLNAFNDSKNEEAVQKAKETIHRFYQQQGLSTEAINKIIKPQEAVGDEAVLEMAKTLGGLIKQSKATVREKLKQETALRAKQEQDELISYNTQVKQAIEQTEEILGVKLDKKQKEELIQYIFVPSTTVNGRKVSQYQADRMVKTKDPLTTVTQAFLYKNGNKLTEKILEKAEGKVTKTLAEKLSGLASGKAGSKSNQAVPEAGRKNILSELDIENIDVVHLPRRR